MSGLWNSLSWINTTIFSLVVCIYFYSIIPSSFERPLCGTKNPSMYEGIWQTHNFESSFCIEGHFGLAGWGLGIT